MFGVGAARLRGRPVTPGDHGCSHAITTPMGVTGVNDGTAVRNDATLLLGLDGLVVERVERAADGRRVVYVVTAEATLVLHRAVVPARVVHRVGTGGAGSGADDGSAAGVGRGCGRRWVVGDGEGCGASEWFVVGDGDGCGPRSGGLVGRGRSGSGGGVG